MCINLVQQGSKFIVTVNMDLGVQGARVVARDAKEARLATDHALGLPHGHGPACPLCREEISRRTA